MGLYIVSNISATFRPFALQIDMEFVDVTHQAHSLNSSQTNSGLDFNVAKQPKVANIGITNCFFGCSDLLC